MAAISDRAAARARLARGRRGLFRRSPGEAEGEGGSGGASRRRGFTLIELMIVVAILLLLIALLLSALLEALGAVETMRCQTRLRQISLAYTQHMADWADVWPPILTGEVPEPQG